MADLIKPGQPEDTEHLEPTGVDSELDLKAVVWSGVILAGITALSFVLMWFMYLGLISWSEDQDPEPYALADQRPDRPPGPALQTSPETGTPEDEYLAWREGQQTLLDGPPTMLDEATARIPIEMAIAAELERRARRAEIGAAVDQLMGDELTAPTGDRRDPELDREISGVQLLDEAGEPMEIEGGGPIPPSIQRGERQRAAERAREAARTEALGPVVEIGDDLAVETEETEGMASAMTDTYEEPLAEDPADNEEEGDFGADGAPPPLS